jgi:hypothetical protein
MIIVGIELTAARALLGDLVILAGIPKAFRIRILIYQIEDGRRKAFALTQMCGGEVGDTPTNLASRRIHITKQKAREVVEF